VDRICISHKGALVNKGLYVMHHFDSILGVFDIVYMSRYDDVKYFLMVESGCGILFVLYSRLCLTWSEDPTLSAICELFNCLIIYLFVYFVYLFKSFIL
jgi:hypothetical protein